MSTADPRQSRERMREILAGTGSPPSGQLPYSRPGPETLDVHVREYSIGAMKTSALKRARELYGGDADLEIIRISPVDTHASGSRFNAEVRVRCNTEPEGGWLAPPEPGEQQQQNRGSHMTRYWENLLTRLGARNIRVTQVHEDEHGGLQVHGQLSGYPHRPDLAVDRLAMLAPAIAAHRRLPEGTVFFERGQRAASFILYLRSTGDPQGTEPGSGWLE